MKPLVNVAVASMAWLASVCVARAQEAGTPARPAAWTVEPSCAERCTCARHLAGGGPTMGLLFFKLGQRDALPGTLWGGRGYGYVLDERLRIGGMGFGSSFGEEDQWFEGFGYGGVTLEFVPRIGRSLEFPLGVLVGMGGGGQTVIQAQDPAGWPSGTEVTSSQGGALFALQPVAGLEANVVQHLKLGAQATFLYAAASPESFLGYGVLFNLAFGKFWPDEL